MKTKLAIIGSSDLGQQIAHIAQSTDMEIVGYFDDFETIKTTQNGIPILGPTDKIEELFSQGVFNHLSIGIGYKHMAKRKELFEFYAKKIPFANVIHPYSFIDITSQLGQGLVIYPGTVIDAKCNIGNNILINSACTIAHDSNIKNHCFLSPRVALGGFVTIEECCILGINSTIIDNVTINENTQIGGATVVINSLEKTGLYVGNPARWIR